MTKKQQVAAAASTDCPWENGDLGRSLEHAKVVDDPEHEASVDAALQLQLISIRLEKSLIEAMKFIASYNKGMGYQPLMRQILHRFATSEIKRISREMEAKRVEDENRLGPLASPEGPENEGRKRA